MESLGSDLPPEVRAEVERIRLQLESEPEATPDFAEGSWLDDVLASRSHIRLLRVLVCLGDRMNLTGRELAQRAEVSHARAVEVIRSLVQTKVIAAHRESSWTIYEINAESPVAAAIRGLFEAERDLTPA